MRKPSEHEPVDPRSTQRKRARKKLFAEMVPYICGSPHFRSDSTFCRRSPTRSGLPKDAPKELELAPREMQDKDLTLQANHISKDIMDNDLINLEWLCPSCHKKEDLKTQTGTITALDDYGYSL